MEHHQDSERLLLVKTGRGASYPIFFADDFASLSVVLEQTCAISARKVCIVTDSNVAQRCLAEVKRQLDGKCAALSQFVMEAGEPNKNLETVRQLYAHLIANHFARQDLLLALGGGVVGDLAGFAAATYMRGIDFAQIPTTLLAQVDSSIGGKTGVDFDHYKNMVGAFHQPVLVYTNSATLSTLSEREFASGMGEVLKHGLIRSESYYAWVIEHLYEISSRDPQTLRHLVLGSCRIKRGIVEKDPTEMGERALLNFGHTIGHAIEKVKSPQLSHGQCVALGCVAAAYISYRRGLLSTEEFYEIRDMNVGFGLSFTVEGIDPAEILSLTKSDKKMQDGHVKFVLLDKIGHAFLDTTVTDGEMRDAIQFITYTEDFA